MLARGWERALGNDTLIMGVRLVGAQEEPWDGGVDGWSAVEMCSVPSDCSLKMAGRVHKLPETLGLEACICLGAFKFKSNLSNLVKPCLKKRGRRRL